LFKLRGSIFIHATQVIDASSKNAFIYGGSASGLTIPTNANDPSGLMDVIYSPGPLGRYNPIIANQGQPGRNNMVADSYGATYPMGAGTYQRTAVEGRPFDAVIGPNQTAGIVNWGVSHIQNNRLLGATGNASLPELAWQSLPRNEWDTKQYLPHTSTFIINNKAEQRDYVGNVIWAAGVKSLGVSQETALMGARVQGALSGVGREDARDQEAIKFGYGGFLLYPNKSNNNGIASVYRK
jgi:hypothetical protein